MFDKKFLLFCLCISALWSPPINGQELIPVSVKIAGDPASPNAILTTPAEVQSAFEIINDTILSGWEALGFDVPWRFQTPVEVIDLTSDPMFLAYGGLPIVEDAVADPETFFFRPNAINIYVIERFTDPTGAARLGFARGPYPGDGGAGVVVAQTALDDVVMGPFVAASVNPGVLILHEIGHHLALDHAGGNPFHSCSCGIAAFPWTTQCPPGVIPGSGVTIGNVTIPELMYCEPLLGAGPCSWMNTNAMHQDACDPPGVDAATKVLPTEEELHHLNYELFAPESGRSHIMRKFLRGDCEVSGALSLHDGVRLINHLYAGAGLDCEDACDADDDGELTMGDALQILNFMFAGGIPPMPPFPSCGTDTEFDFLSCESSICL